MKNILPVAIVTGASRGIGKSIIKKLSGEGMSCIAIASSKVSIERISLGEHLQVTHDKQRHRSLAIDLSQWPQWTFQDKHFGIECLDNRSGFFRLFDTWEDTDTVYMPTLLVNCAGITQESLSVRTNAEAIARIMHVNFMSCVSLTNMSIKQMIKGRRRNKQLRPCIINISSILGTSSLEVPGTSVYSASKAALTQYSKVVAEEVKPWNIRVSSIAPGLVPGTDMVQDLEEAARSSIQHISKHATSSPEQIALQVWHMYHTA